MSHTPSEENAGEAQQTGRLLDHFPVVEAGAPAGDIKALGKRLRKSPADQSARRLLFVGLLPTLLLLYFATAPAQAVHPHMAIENAHTRKSAATLPDIPAANGHGMGRMRLRRLSRAEYNNTVRDLCGIDVHPADSFPNDDVGYGFDNIGSVLSLSPLLLEKYLAAAEQIAHAAFQNPDDLLPPVRFPAAQLIYIHKSERQNSFAGDHASLYASDSEVGVDYYFPQSQLYALRALAWQDRAGNEAAKMGFKLDGKLLSTVDVPNEALDLRPYEIRVAVSAGMHRFSTAFLNDFFDGSDPNNHQKTNRDRNLNVEALEIIGPLQGEGAQSFLSKQLGAVEPDPTHRMDVARRFLTDFARRAYRRPVSKEEVKSLLRYVTLALQRGETFRRGIEYAVTATLCSPNFLFRVERASPMDGLPPYRPDRPLGGSRSKVRRAGGLLAHSLVDDYGLATRLSYFLWSSMPDEELFDLAAHGKLKKPRTLAIQARRMLRDPRARALSENFAGQWLQLRNLATVSPDPVRFPDFNEELRHAMRTETELFFRSIVEEDSSVLALLNAPYTFLNEPLAKHYGISGVEGKNFRRVRLSGDQRGGLLSQASLLTITSNPTRTSPTRRGRWIIENLLGTPLPPALPNVPPLADDKKAPLTGTLRQRMEQHRANPACAGCHARMDPVGFGLENYDAVGRWRDRDGDGAVDASGVLPDGSKFVGPAQLKEVLLHRKSEFVNCLCQKLLTYALGRGMEPEDQRAIHLIVRKSATDDYKFSALIFAIVESELFRKQ
jgi:hypothetical protein